MKFSMLFEGNAKIIQLTPENPGEAMLLASCVPDQETGTRVEAMATVEWSQDRPSYRKAQALKVVL